MLPGSVFLDTDSPIYNLRLSTFDYPEGPPPIWRGWCWQRRHRTQCGIDQFTDRPDVIGNPECHRWRTPQTLVHTTKIVERNV